MKKLDNYLTEVLDVYAYCLLGNHFHLLVKVKEDLSDFRVHKNFKVDTSTHDVVSKLFRNFFQSYAMAFNVQQNRCGTLFQTPFKRALVTDEHYFTNLICYIHSNPQKHNLMNDFREWEWSSYRTILSKKKTKLQRQKVLEWFGGELEYLKFHAEVHNLLIE